MHRQTLSLKETVIGKDHPSTLDSINNLAVVLQQQGKYEEAGFIQLRYLSHCSSALSRATSRKQNCCGHKKDVPHQLDCFRLRWIHVEVQSGP